MSGRKNIQTEDGTILEVHEGVILSADGEPVQDAANARTARPARPWLLPLAAGVFIPLMLFAGFAIIGVVVAVLLAFWVLRGVLAILGLGGNGGSRPRGSFTYVVKRGR